MTHLSREIELIRYFNRKFQWNVYIPAKDILVDLEWVDIVSERQLRRYIKDINDSGIDILTKRGIDGGYKLRVKVEL